MSVESVTLLLTGDVMTGRGIDQLMPAPNAPDLHEPYIGDARDYVRLAEDIGGPIARPVPFDYAWGESLSLFDRWRPARRIVNLETAVTTHGAHWPGKGVHYRMHPAHMACLQAARIDACALANNHVLDWQREGLAQTLSTLQSAGIRTAGAGVDAEHAAAPAVLPLAEGAGGRRVLLFSVADESSGVPAAWRATDTRPGVHLLRDLGARSLQALADRIAAERRAGDIVIVSIHWGANWGHAIDPRERSFAQGLIDARADLVHGHSSHHAKAFERYRGRLILYGCGDFINDYEGIGGHAEYRGDLAAAWFVTFGADGVEAMRVALFKSARLRLRHAAADDRREWRDLLNRVCAAYGTGYVMRDDGALHAATAEAAAAAATVRS